MLTINNQHVASNSQKDASRNIHGKVLLHESRALIHTHNIFHSSSQHVLSVEKADHTNKAPARQMDEHAVREANQTTLPKCALHLSTTSYKVTKRLIQTIKLEDSNDASSSDEEYLIMTNSPMSKVSRVKLWVNEIDRRQDNCRHRCMHRDSGWSHIPTDQL